jgi:GT2 family glycosyltransferase
LQLSIIIVNYNVKYFLEQCLCSVKKAIETLDAEIIVVDNHSTDGSIEYLTPIFPDVSFLINEKNTGFAKANNKAVLQAKGDYILYLNPDTIVAEDCFTKCISFFEKHTDCGALGVRMIDGSGNFLPESKRSFPSPITSFYKLIGLSRIFFKSKIFNKYTLGFLNEKETHEVDVLAGAFMMVRKNIVDITQGFDESFFMYGEDVDLSYRIQQLGYKNYYFGENSIIHFKGESTRRGSINYVLMFYKAMNIFVQKHYSKRKAKMFSFLINIAIILRAGTSLLHRLFNKIGLPLLDALVIFLCMYLTKIGWVKYIHDGVDFPAPFVAYAIPVFTILFLSTAWLAGIYDDLFKPSKSLLASALAIIVILAAYSLLPETSRFSRGVVLIGGSIAGIMITLIHSFFIKIKWIKKAVEENERSQQTLIVSSPAEYEKAMQLLQKASLQERVLGRIKINGDNENSIGSIAQLKELLLHLSVREIIFCEGGLSFEKIIATIPSIPQKISIRFHANNSNSIIGSDSKTTTGEAITEYGYYKLAQPYNKRMKRIVDVSISFFILLSLPFQFVFIKNTVKGLQNAFVVLIGKKTWVGYSASQKNLPVIKPAVLTTYGLPVNMQHPISNETLEKLNALYVKDYDWFIDVKIIFNNYNILGE